MNKHVFVICNIGYWTSIQLVMCCSKNVVTIQDVEEINELKVVLPNY